MNTKGTYITLLLAILLGGYFVVFETDMLGMAESSRRDRERRGEVSSPSAGKAFDALDGITTDDIASLDIRQGDAPAVTITRTGDADSSWQQTAPATFAMQTWSMDELLNDAIGLRYTSRIKPSELSPATAGLEPAKAQLRISGKHNDESFTHTLHFGRTVAAGRAYLRIDDNPTIYVVNDRLHKRLNQPVSDLRSKSLATITPGSVQHISLVRGDEKVELTQDAGIWRMIAPRVGRADRAKAEELVNAISYASVAEFIEDAPASLARFGLDKPAAILTLHQTTITEEDERTYKLAIGNPTDLSKEHYFAMWQDVPVVFTLGKSTFEKLRMPAEDMASRKLVEVSAGNVQQVAINRRTGTLVFVKNNGAWSFGDPEPDYSIDGSRVKELIKELTTLQAASIDTRDSPKLAKPDVTLTITAGGDEHVLHLNLVGEEYRVRLTGETFTKLVPAEKLEWVNKNALFFRDRTILNVPPEDITGLKLRRSGPHAASYSFARDKNGAWQTDGHDTAAVNRLLGFFTPLRATEWGPWKASADQPGQVNVTISLRDGNSRQFMLLDPSAHAAAMDDVDTDFRIEPDLTALLLSELRDRAVLKFDVDQIASIGIGNNVVSRSTDGTFTGDWGRDIDEAKAGALFDTISGLKVEHWLQTASPAGDRLALQVNTRDSRSRLLKLWQADNGKAIGQVDDGPYFTLPADVYAKLTAGVLAASEK